MYVAVFVEDDYPKQEVIFISGNIGVTVDDTYKACDLGMEFVKKPNDDKINVNLGHGLCPIHDINQWFNLKNERDSIHQGS
ncbi:lactoylglutathione lyase-like [Populus alba]|uniref:lactoylglutathione lyase-like n=1 Tax=Populus alba TaxID=43335 RepID=UPI003CC6F88F